MDEDNQQTVKIDPEALPEGIIHEASLIRSPDEELKKQLTNKNSSDVSNSEAVSETNTNGVDNELVKIQFPFEDGSTSEKQKDNSESSFTFDSKNQTEEKISNNNHSAVSSELESHSVDDICTSENKDKEISDSSGLNSQGVAISNINNSCSENVDISAGKCTVGEILEEASSLQDSAKDVVDDITDLNKNLESSENNSMPKSNQEVEVSTENKLVSINSENLNDDKNDYVNKDVNISDETMCMKMNVNDTNIESDCEGNYPKDLPLNLDSVETFEANEALENTSSDNFGQNENLKEISISKTLSEGEQENEDIECSIQESVDNQSNINTSTEQEEENLNKSENDGNEVMDTEVVNCNEIEQIDLSEGESQKDKEIDRIGIESNDTSSKEDDKEEDDALRADNEKDDKIEPQKTVLIDEVSNNQPGSSEEETITGDTNNQNVKNKDGELCIVPDNIVPTISILPQNKKEVKNNEVESRRKSSDSKISTPPLQRRKSRLSNKKNEGSDSSKARPIRNAAKLAGNKIKSLVENDLVFDEHITGSDGIEKEKEFQENTDRTSKMCAQCKEVKVCKFVIPQEDGSQYLCSEQCSQSYKNAQMDSELNEIESMVGEFVRKCAQCQSQITVNEKCLFWETMDFCNEDCLGKYQTSIGSSCANCKGTVASSSLGKYCVRFGYDIKQFCSANCLEEYKKGLKVCSYCQKDISTGPEGFLAPVGDKGQFKDFCTQSCMEKYEKMSSSAPIPDVIEECAVCSNTKPVRLEVELDNKTHKLCSEPCFAAFKFVNNIKEGQCDMCRKYFDQAKTGNFSLFLDECTRTFCCKTCMNVYILANRKIVPCNWCKVKKYNFDMIKKVNANGQLTMMCSLNCLMLYQVSVNAVCSRRVKCDFCLAVTQAQYHLTMSDATVRNFCSYNCVMSFQVVKKRLDLGLGEDFASIAQELFSLRRHNRYPKQSVDLIQGADQLSSPIPTGNPRRVTPRRSHVEPSCVPVISSVQSLASPNGPASPSARVSLPRQDVNMVTQGASPLSIPATVTPIPAPPPPQVYQQIITEPPPAKEMKNKSVLCKPYSHTKGVSCRPHPCMKETQTDQSLFSKCLIPIPIPIYIPAPMHMFATPFPVPVPFPLPVPVPIFIPTTRNSAKGIFKEIKKIQEKIPTDPFEADLLMMAEMVAGDKKQDPTDSESEDGNDGDDGADGTFSPENVDTSNTFGDDMLQMALKMASELEEPAVDMESVLTSNTITTTTQPAVDPNKGLYASDPDDPDQVHVMSINRGRKRSVRGSRNSVAGTPSKRGRRTSGSVDVPLLPPPEPVPPPRIEVEKPDANMCLKYTFGVNAWRHWVMQKNAELEKVAMTNRKIKLFKPELLQLTADELNFSLCLFVKEVRKPNGTEYAPDTIYYLCLGIQQYLFENGRIDNIFTDSYYEKFTDCLDEVAKKFAALYNDSQYIVTRVEEEHLWESKQLGAHSPHVLLSTLMFFNTKHFNLVTVEEHMQLSFSHIMKHWKRNPNTPGVAKVPGSRNVLLRFYPPQSALEANSRKKKVYEQQENEENPLRCPVKLYEFYLSKCPESVKTRNDVFYLLPERSCVPDSPVWYSTMALGKEPLMKMLHRIKMVKEINIALLSC